VNPIINQALIAALFISLVPMAAISIGAGAVTLLQAITQVQEQSMVHFVRIVVLVLVLIWGGHEAYAQLEQIFMSVLSLCALPGGG
jgi:type III secretory pathway component EscS